MQPSHIGTFNIFKPPPSYNVDQVNDFYQDLVFVIILTILIPTFFIFTVKSLKNEDNRNIHNFVIAITILSSLMNRYLCMLYSLIYDQNKKVFNNERQFYWYYQLPFDLLNTGVVAQFYQWVEVVLALNSIIQFNYIQNVSDKKGRVLDS